MTDQNDNQGNEKKTFRVVVVSVALVVGISVLYKYIKSTGISYNLERAGSSQCIKEVKAAHINDEALTGIFKKAEKVEIALGWYECNSIKRGDMVVIKKGTTNSPTIRVVYGVPGDTFGITQDTSTPTWNLQINGKTIKLGTIPYRFGHANQTPWFQTVVKERKGVLKTDDLILLSNINDGSYDSVSEGLYTPQSLLGKVVSGEKIVVDVPTEKHTAEKEPETYPIVPGMPEAPKPIAKPRTPTSTTISKPGPKSSHKKQL
jgi:hypothetical protein